MKDRGTDAERYLKLPYARVITPDPDTGTYTAEVPEFPGCVTQGSTVAEAHERLEDAAASWIEAATGLGQEIPPPSRIHEYRGRIALRLPRSLHRRASQLAERDGTSLNQYIVVAIAEKVGASDANSRLPGRAEHPLKSRARR